jgi:hypothetical protein
MFDCEHERHERHEYQTGHSIQAMRHPTKLLIPEIDKPGLPDRASTLRYVAPDSRTADLDRLNAYSYSFWKSGCGMVGKYTR